MMYKKLGMIGVVTVALLALVTGSSTATVPDTYNQYSLMDTQSAGQYWTTSGTGPSVEAGQWTWGPQTNGQDWVSWGDAAKWPPTGHEVFIHSGNWVLLDGWSGNGTYYTQRVTSETISNADCVTGKTVLPTDPTHPGLQHYTQWTIPTGAYCLFATGIITEQSSGKTIRFSHQQVWSTVASEPNKFIGARPALQQHEMWWDDNGHPYAQTLDRSVFIGKSVGMAFHIQNYNFGTTTVTWSADLRYTWTWS